MGHFPGILDTILDTSRASRFPVDDSLARAGDDAGGLPAKARSLAAELRWGRRQALCLLPARDAALGPLGAFLGMPASVPSPESPTRAASTASGHG